MKPGTRVRVSEGYTLESYRGEVGTVVPENGLKVGLDDRWDEFIPVNLDCDGGQTGLFLPHEIEPVSDS